MKTIINTVGDEVNYVLNQIDEEKVIQFANLIHNTSKIYVAGAGRSGLIGKVFAMRLMHSGYEVYVVGETITPSITENDVLVIISGSGNTGSLTLFAEKAKEIGVNVALFTTNEHSNIGKISDLVVTLPAATKDRETNKNHTIQPLGSQFDQSVHLLLDAVIVYLLENYGNEQENENLSKRHTNLE